MVYKQGPPYKVRPVEEICEDIRETGNAYGEKVKSVFFPAGNTIAMPTEDLAAICRFAVETFPTLQRITVYGSPSMLRERVLQV